MSGSHIEFDRVAQRLRAGDREAFRRFVSVVNPTLLGRARSLMVDAESAHDIVQRALVRIWNRHDDLPETWRALCSYSLKVVTNLGLDTIRDNALRSRREAEAMKESGRHEDVDHGSDPSWAIMAREAWDLVMKLPEPLRDVMLLRYGEGLTIKEVADELETSCETVSVRQRKALLMLREKLDVHVASAVGPAILAALGGGMIGNVLNPVEATAITAAASRMLERAVDEALGFSGRTTAVTASAGTGLSSTMLVTAMVLLLILGGVIATLVLNSDTRQPQATPAPRITIHSTVSANQTDPAETGSAVLSAPSATQPPANGGATSVTPSPVESPEPAMPPVEVACALSGIVVNTSGHPVADMEVAACFEHAVGGGGPEDYSSPIVTRSGADGRFRFDRLWPLETYHITIQPQAGYLGQHVIMPPMPDRHEYAGDDVRLVVVRPGRITGVARKPDGQPAVGALVAIGMPRADGDHETGTVRLVNGCVIGGEEDMRAFVSGMHFPVARTDEAGNFALDGVRPGTHAVSVTHQACRDAVHNQVMVREGSTTGPLHVQLEAAPTLEVALADGDGHAVAGATVRLFTGRHAEAAWTHGGEWVTEWQRESVTGPDGTTTIDVVGSHTITLQVIADGYAPRTERVWMDDGSHTRRRFRLDRVGVIRGRLLDLAGQAVVDATVTVAPDNDARPPIPFDIDAAGNFAIPADAGFVRLTFHRDGYADGRCGLVRVTAGNPTDIGTVVMQSARTLRFTVVDVDDQPVPDATITLQAVSQLDTPGEDDAPREPLTTCRTDEDGSARVALTPGHYRTFVASEGAATRIQRLGVPARNSDNASDDDLACVVRVQPTGSIAGTTRRFTGRAWPGAIVRLVDADHVTDVLAEARADVAGQFCFRDLAPGTYRLSVGSEATVGHGFSPELTLEPGQNFNTPMARQTSSAMALYLTYPDGSPVVGVRVVCGWLGHGPDGHFTLTEHLATRVSDEKGMVVLGDLPTDTSLAVTVSAGNEWGVLYGLRTPAAMKADRATIQLQPASQSRGEISGVVTHVEGGVAQGFPVVVLRYASEGDPLVRRVVSTNAEGRFVVQDLPPGRYRVEVDQVGWSEERAWVVLEPGSADEAAVDASDTMVATTGLCLRPAGWLAFLVNLEGSEADRPRVWLRIVAVGDETTRRSNPVRVGSACLIAALRQGETYRLEFCAPGYETVTVIHQVRSGDDPIRVTLTRGE